MTAAQTKTPSNGGNRSGGMSNTSFAHPIANHADRLLDRLDGVRKSGKGWIAKCPAHTDRSASLSIAQGDKGATLVHCFAGCPVHDVLTAVGLTISDLFPPRITANMSIAERNALREYAKQAQWKAALNALQLEVGVVHIAARQLADGHPLQPDDLNRVGVACDRIRDAREVLTNGRY